MPADLRHPPPGRRLLLNAPQLAREAGAELVGTGLLTAIIVGSGIAAHRLSPTDTGLELLEISFATVLGLAALITLLLPISASFNPVVTIAFALLDRDRRWLRLMTLLVIQIVGAVGGTLLANAMFGIGPGLATMDRVDPPRLLGEIVATAGLVVLLLGLARTGRATLIAPAAAGWIGAACWFTSSTAFANPAVTIGRMFSDTLTGIAPESVLPFIGAQFLGGAIGAGLALALFPKSSKKETA